MFVTICFSLFLDDEEYVLRRSLTAAEGVPRQGDGIEIFPGWAEEVRSVLWAGELGQVYLYLTDYRVVHHEIIREGLPTRGQARSSSEFLHLLNEGGWTTDDRSDQKKVMDRLLEVADADE